jgi:hypothetical protein
MAACLSKLSKIQTNNAPYGSLERLMIFVVHRQNPFCKGNNIPSAGSEHFVLIAFQLAVCLPVIRRQLKGMITHTGFEKKMLRASGLSHCLIIVKTFRF